MEDRVFIGFLLVQDRDVDQFDGELNATVGKDTRVELLNTGVSVRLSCSPVVQMLVNCFGGEQDQQINLRRRTLFEGPLINRRRLK